MEKIMKQIQAYQSPNTFLTLSIKYVLNMAKNLTTECIFTPN